MAEILPKEHVPLQQIEYIDGVAVFDLPLELQPYKTTIAEVFLDVSAMSVAFYLLGRKTLRHDPCFALSLRSCS